MIGSKKIVCIIPARLAAQRFPRKMLSYLGHQPLLAWVWQAATKVSVFDEVHFAVDSEEIAALIRQFGGSYFMTSVACQTGTDRLIELQQRGLVTADIWVNWQGDEPFIEEQMITDLLQSSNAPNEECWTLRKKIDKPEQIISKNFAKVVQDAQGNALYFSRSPIPCYRDSENVEQAYYKHVGIYAYANTLLARMANLPLGLLEQAEKLEQLRLLEAGIKIRLHTTNFEVIGIDTPEDLERAHERILKTFTDKQKPLTVG